MQICDNCLNIFKENYNLRWVVITGVERAKKILELFKIANKMVSNLNTKK